MKKLNLWHLAGILFCLFIPVVITIFSTQGTFTGKYVGQTAEGFDCSYGLFLARSMFPFDILSWFVCALLSGNLAWRVAVSQLGKSVESLLLVRWGGALAGTIFLFFGFFIAAVFHGTALEKIVTWMGI